MLPERLISVILEYKKIFNFRSKTVNSSSNTQYMCDMYVHVASDFWEVFHRQAISHRQILYLPDFQRNLENRKLVARVRRPMEPTWVEF